LLGVEKMEMKINDSFEMNEARLTILSFFGLGLSLTTVNQVMQLLVLSVSLFAGILAILKHFKEK
jgi:hypothetical protein